MTALRRLSIAALVLAYCQIVLGAIVRITGSGWGCGEHWPQCDGHWFPPFDRVDLIIEVMHRYLAAGLTVAVLALAVVAWRRRALAGVGGAGGVLRSASLALGIVVATALLGAVTIKLRLNPFIIVAHLALAMSLLAALVVTAIRAGGLGARSVTTSATAAKTWRVARVAVVLAFAVLVLGALTANLGAAGACLGFPGCRVYASPNRGLVYLQLTHRVVAFLFAFHVVGIVMAMRRRAESRVVKRAAAVALGAIALQILVAAALVEMRLPPVLQSLHQAVGTLVWIAIVVFAALARRAVDAQPAHLEDREPAPDVDHAENRITTPRTSGAAAIIEASSREPEFKARLADVEKSGHAYESAMLALLAQAESQFENVVSYEGDDIAELPSFEAPTQIAVTSEPTIASAPAADPAVSLLPATGYRLPAAQPTRPHSVAVIMARGADF